MKINLESGKLIEATFLPSPNCDDFPEGCDPNLVVIHNISLPPGEFGGRGIEHLFLNCLNPDEHPYYKTIAGLRVSAHLLVRRTGELVQFVPFNKRAWHAGVSSFAGRARCNDFSMGIELEGDDMTPFTKKQYVALILVTKALLATYPGLSADRIVGHSDIAPGRKTDPGEAFDWQQYREGFP